MPLFNRTFTYYALALSGYDSNGNAVTGSISSRVVVGTIQPMSAAEIAAQAEGNRQNGAVKIYSSDRLAYRVQKSDAQGFVKDNAGNIYEITGEAANLNALISHYKYTANLVPVAQVPAGIV